MTEQHVIFGKGALRMPASELLTKINLAQKDIQSKIQEETVRRTNPFDGKLSGDVRALFEKWRRGQ
jgi:hypothetical protein